MATFNDEIHEEVQYHRPGTEPAHGKPVTHVIRFNSARQRPADWMDVFPKMIGFQTTKVAGEDAWFRGPRPVVDMVVDLELGYAIEAWKPEGVARVWAKYFRSTYNGMPVYEGVVYAERVKGQDGNGEGDKKDNKEDKEESEKTLYRYVVETEEDVKFDGEVVLDVAPLMKKSEKQEEETKEESETTETRTQKRAAKKLAKREANKKKAEEEKKAKEVKTNEGEKEKERGEADDHDTDEVNREIDDMDEELDVGTLDAAMSNLRAHSIIYL